MELSLEDCNKIEDWGKSHMFNESVIFDKILKRTCRKLVRKKNA